MSQPPSQDSWSSAPGQQLPPGAPVPTPAFAVPAQPIQYLMPHYGGRPGLITAIGVISIVIASLSIIWSSFTVLQAGAYYMMSVMSATVAVSQARVATAAPPPVALPPNVSVAGMHEMAAAGPRGMSAPERQSALRDLTRRQPLLPSRKRHLDAILAAAGKDLGTDSVVESGTMPEMRSGEPPPDYFVTGAGRLEVFNDRAVFYPSNGSPMVRVSAPPPRSSAVQDTGEATSTGEVTSEVEAAESGPVALQSASPATGPAATRPAPGALTPAEIQSVVQQAQSLSGNALNPAQVASLQTVLSAPGQQLVQAGAAQGSIVTAFAQPGSSAVVQFSDGGSVTLGPQGNVTAMMTAPVMPTFSFQPGTLVLMVVGAVASLALAVFLLVCGIATLRQSPCARRLHLIYAVTKIPLAIMAGLAAAWVARDLMAGVAGVGAAVGMTGYSLFSGLVPVVLGCAYPIALLIALNLKSVREYYEVDGGRTAGQATAA